jgi:hypothetical protein
VVVPAGWAVTELRQPLALVVWGRLQALLELLLLTLVEDLPVADLTVPILVLLPHLRLQRLAALAVQTALLEAQELLILVVVAVVAVLMVQVLPTIPAVQVDLVLSSLLTQTHSQQLQPSAVV